MDTFYFKPEPDIITTKDNLIEIQSCNCLLNPSLSILKSYTDVSLYSSSEHISFFYKHKVKLGDIPCQYDIVGQWSQPLLQAPLWLPDQVSKFP